jgi:hypothetical protein
MIMTNAGHLALATTASFFRLYRYVDYYFIDLSSHCQPNMRHTRSTLLAAVMLAWASSAADAQPSIQGDGQDIVLTPGDGGHVLIQ